MEVCSIIFYYKLSRIYNYNFDDIRWNNNISLKKLCRQLNCFSIIIIEKLFAQRIKLTKIKVSVYFEKLILPKLANINILITFHFYVKWSKRNLDLLNENETLTIGLM